MIEQAWGVVKAHQLYKDAISDEGLALSLLSDAITALHMALELEPDECLIIRSECVEKIYDLNDPVSINIRQALYTVLSTEEDT